MTEATDAQKPDSEAVDPASAGSGWILCVDRMPDLDEIVFLFAPPDWIIVGNRSDDGEGWLWGRCYGHFWWDANASRWDGDCEQDDDYKPTHWRPLPYPPNESSSATRPT